MAVYTNYCSAGSKAHRYALRLTVNQTKEDKVNNTSDLSYTLELGGASLFGLPVDYVGSSMRGYTCNGLITIKNKTTGVTVATADGSSNGNVSPTSAITIASGTATVPHNPDGTLTLTISGSFSGGTSAQASAGSVDAKLTLPRIPRASEVKATDGDIGSVITIYITRADDSFTHKLTYEFEGLTGTVPNASNTDKTEVPFTIPTTFYAKIPDAKQGDCKITCTTYSGETAIGTSETTFKAKVNEEDNKPTITGVSIVDTITTPAGTSWLVKNVSKPKVTATFGAKNSATLKSYRVECLDGQAISDDSTATALNVTFPKAITSNKFKITVTDSRGFTATNEKTITNWTDYVPLSLNPTFSRVTPTGGKVKLVYQGNYYKGNFNNTANTLSVKYRYKVSTANSYGSWITLTPTVSNTENKYSQTIELPETYTYTNAYDFQIIATDKINTAGITETRRVSQGIPIYWWNKTAFTVEGLLHATRSSLGALTITRSGSANASAILFKNSNGNLGYIGMTGSANGKLIRYTSDASTSYEIIDRSVVDNHTSIGSLMGMTDFTGSTNVVTRNAIAYWDGRFMSNGNKSNLTYAKDGLIQSKPTVLYDNATGTTGTVTLSSSLANYVYIDVYYGKSSGNLYCQRFYKPDGKFATLYEANLYNTNEGQELLKFINFSGTSITVARGSYRLFNSSATGGATSENDVKIARVEGWK